MRRGADAESPSALAERVLDETGYRKMLVEADDAVAETDGVKLVVDPMSLDLVQDSAVDFVEDLGGAAFKVQNPNAASGCGCGSSFSV